MQKTPAIFFFVKFPIPGKVKTRLASSLGDQKAALLYKDLVEKNYDILLSLRGLGFKIWVSYDPFVNEEWYKNWLPDADGYLAQKEGGLGRRMSEVFQYGREDFHQMFILGSDTLGLKPSILQNASKKLAQNDVVIGPAQDGGYYLIGMKEPHSDLFEDIPWSTSQVLEITQAKLKKNSLNYDFVDVLRDMDAEESLSKQQKEQLYADKS